MNVGYPTWDHIGGEAQHAEGLGGAEQGNQLGKSIETGAGREHLMEMCLKDSRDLDPGRMIVKRYATK